MKNLANIGYHCWITNLTKRDILIGDLGVRIQSRHTVDVLDYRHSYISVERVRVSMEKGSLSKRLATKPPQIVIRQSAPEPAKHARTIDISETSFPNKYRTVVQVEEKIYPELEINSTPQDEEQFANEMAESALLEHAPTMTLKKDEENANNNSNNSGEQPKDRSRVKRGNNNGSSKREVK